MSSAVRTLTSSRGLVALLPSRQASGLACPRVRCLPWCEAESRMACCHIATKQQSRNLYVAATSHVASRVAQSPCIMFGLTREARAALD
eukprot:XP_001691569.1 predicted protein [Chlamydomonas reinhardtii]